MTKFIFENAKLKVIFLAAKIDFWGQNGVRAQERACDVMICIRFVRYCIRFVR